MRRGLESGRGTGWGWGDEVRAGGGAKGNGGGRGGLMRTCSQGSFKVQNDLKRGREGGREFLVKERREGRDER